MQNASTKKMELFSTEVFKTFLEHEVNKSRRYGDSLTLIDLLVETDPTGPEAQQKAEALIINMLHLHLRNVDVPCKRENEFLILMPSTSAPGARTACERVRKLMDSEHQTDGGVPFKLLLYIGLAAMPTDHSLSSSELSQDALQAMQYARTNHLANVVAFTDIK